jgi:hypothetical protein
MSTPSQEPADNALEALQGFESVLEERDDSREVAEGLLTAAHAESERILAAARAAGERTGESRRAAMLSAARAEATAIEATAQADAATIADRTSAHSRQLIVELSDLVLGEEL